MGSCGSKVSGLGNVRGGHGGGLLFGLEEILANHPAPQEREAALHQHCLRWRWGAVELDLGYCQAAEGILTSDSALEHWTNSIPSAGCSRVHRSLPNQSTWVLWTWRRHLTVSLVAVCWRCARGTGTGQIRFFFFFFFSGGVGPLDRRTARPPLTTNRF